MRIPTVSAFERIGSYRIPWIVPLLLALGVCILAILWFNWKIDKARWDKTNRQLYVFKLVLAGYSVETETLPANLDEATQVLGEHSVYGPRMRSDAYLVMEGRDAWGNDLVYVLEVANRKVIIRSVGSNGCDDGGATDDLQYELDMGWMKPRVKLGSQ